MAWIAVDRAIQRDQRIHDEHVAEVDLVAEAAERCEPATATRHPRRRSPGERRHEAGDYLKVVEAATRYGEIHRGHGHALEEGVMRDGLAAVAIGLFQDVVTPALPESVTPWDLNAKAATPLILGTMLILLMLAAPGGIVGSARQLRARLAVRAQRPADGPIPTPTTGGTP